MSRVVFCFFLFILPALAALPPLSPEELLEEARCVVVGTVVKLESSKKLRSNGYDNHYTLKIQIAEVKKGNLKAGQEIEVFCKQTGARMTGWAGPQGQNDVPDKGDSGVFYLSWGKNGYRLLEPNGWSQQTISPQD